MRKRPEKNIYIVYVYINMHNTFRAYHNFICDYHILIYKNSVDCISNSGSFEIYCLIWRVLYYIKIQKPSVLVLAQLTLSFLAWASHFEEAEHQFLHLWNEGIGPEELLVLFQLSVWMHYLQTKVVVRICVIFHCSCLIFQSLMSN